MTGLILLSVRGVAAIDRNDRAENETGRRAAKPEHGCAQFFGLAEPADRLIAPDLDHLVRGHFEQLVEHRGLENARGRPH